MEKIKAYIPHTLFGIYLVVFFVTAFNPYSRAVWIVENAPIMALVSVLVVLYWRGVRFSNTAYVLMALLPIIHTVGGYYTFERVPFDWFNDLFGFERNMYDRVGHFTVGFYALPIIEYLESRKLVASRFVSITYAVFAVAFVAVFYEWVEWLYAALYGGEAGAAFLGSQGDIWDAQKDMLMDVSGAVVVAITAFFRKHFI
jgi:putative membrane protein